MPAEATLFKNKQITLQACSHDGQFVLPESGGTGFPSSGSVGGGGNFKLNQYGQFSFCTGGSNGYLPDVAPTASGSEVLVSSLRCPLNMRPYLTRIDIDVVSVIPWNCTSPTSIPYLSIEDTLGTPLVVIPWSALKGLSSLMFPAAETPAPLMIGPGTVNTTFGTPVTTFTYAGGVVTMASDLFSSLTSETQMVGAPVEIVSGTGIGQTAQITACAAGAFTLSCNWGAFGQAAPNSSNAYGTVAPDATSVIAIYWQPLKTYGSGTSLTLANAGGTPYVSEIYDNGFNVMIVAGASQGSVRPVSASSTAGVLTLPYTLNTAGSASTSILSISNETNLDGAVDMVCDDKLASAQLNTGLQAVWSSAAGTSIVGSNVRIYGEGYWAA